MVARLSWPAIMAQLSTLLMEYIDAAMVGHLGAEPAASIGLIATTTWLFWGLGTATVMGYSVQVAHLLGGGKDAEARSVVRQGTVVVTAVGILVALLAVAIAPGLPHWLGGKGAVCDMSTSYFSIFGASMPVVYLTFMAGAMLRSSGNMLVPGVIAVVMCTLDVVFNFFMIYPAHAIETPWGVLTLPGAGLGVTGAAIGTAMAQVVGCVFLLWYLLRRSPALSRPWSRGRGFVGTWWRLNSRVMRHAVSVASPLALERVVMCGAQILITAIVAPLGNTAIAANAFAVTAESLCYMPGYGIGEAATTPRGGASSTCRKLRAHYYDTWYSHYGRTWRSHVVLRLRHDSLFYARRFCPRIRSHGLAHRGLGRADVWRRHSRLRHRHRRTLCHRTGFYQFRQYLGCPPDVVRYTCSVNGAVRRVAGHVHRIVLPRCALCSTLCAWPVAETRHSYCRRVFACRYLGPSIEFQNCRA